MEGPAAAGDGAWFEEGKFALAKRSADEVYSFAVSACCGCFGWSPPPKRPPNTMLAEWDAGSMAGTSWNSMC